MGRHQDGTLRVPPGAQRGQYGSCSGVSRSDAPAEQRSVDTTLRRDECVVGLVRAAREPRQPCKWPCAAVNT